jgi:hypothetical protein
MDCMPIEAASALPLNNGNQTAKSTATNFLESTDIENSMAKISRIVNQRRAVAPLTN